MGDTVHQGFFIVNKKGARCKIYITLELCIKNESLSRQISELKTGRAQERQADIIMISCK